MKTEFFNSLLDANMELVYCHRPGKDILIIDGVTGEIDWDSTGEFNTIYIAGADYPYETDWYPGIYGTSPFVDINQDGIMEITFWSGNGPAGTSRTVYVVGITGGSSSVSGNNGASVGLAAHIEQNFPNPFNASTLVEYELTQECRVEIVVYDVSGAVVRALVDGQMRAGAHSVVWDGCNDSGVPLASGLYFYQLQAGSYRSVKKALLLK